MASATLEAGRAALDRGAWEAARQAFEAAVGEAETPAALEGLGSALFWLDRTDEAMDLRERAFRLYREAGDVRAAARIAYGLAVDCVDLRGEAPAAGWLERARRLLEGVETGPEHGWLALWEGHFALLHRHDHEVARARARSALEIAGRFRVFDLEMLARGLEGLVHVALGKVEEGMRRLDEATAAALGGEMTDLDAVSATCCLLVHACERVRDYDRAAQWGERVARFSREWGIGPALTVCRTQYAAMLVGRGEWAEAEEELARATERLSESRPLLVPEGLEHLAELRRRQGRFDEAERLFGLVEGRSLALLGRGAIALDRGEPGAAADLLDRFLRRTPPDNWSGRASALELLARAHLARGERAPAEAALDTLQELVERAPTPTNRAAALQVDGLLQAHDGRWDDARRRLEDAVDLYLGAQAPFEAGRGRLDLARSLESAGRGEGALREVRSALACFSKLGAAWEASRAETMLRKSTDTPAEDVAQAPEALLTAREIEVLRLVAQGLGDKEAADRLSLSAHTVHRHLSNIRLKLGLPSRTAAVAWAARNGVL